MSFCFDYVSCISAIIEIHGVEVVSISYVEIIDSLMYLKEKFRSAFVTNKEKPKTEANLRLIKQGPQEPLREYIS